MSSKRLIVFVCLLLSLFILAGCLTFGRMGSGSLEGYVFKFVRVPLTINLDNTPSTIFQASGKILKIKEPFSGYNFYAEFNSNAIGDVARKHGLKKVYFADMEIFSIFGIFGYKEVHIYGE
ncbi:MAG: TRL-like family protein [Proteobacteria bacterium]|nr:TRL-like family protein [Pseudomonadota bacterium]MBU4288649.1 TRL-like family protein [Pseudomonadota bacterium]MCG2757624.1 TRL-like family protein [Desulfobacteraceae bacterium]